MPRLFLPFGEEKEIELPEKSFHYLAHVMRLKEGDNVCVFNGKDGLWQTRFHLTGKKKAVLVKEELLEEQTETDGPFLYAAVIKQMDLTVMKATELGVKKIIPVITEYSNAHVNIDHLKNIAIEASEQCERLDIPEITNPVRFADALKDFPKEMTLCYLSERKGEDYCPSFPEKTGFFIGPEGGFSDSEFQMFLKKEKACRLNLGKRILRAETASLVAITLWQYSNTCIKRNGK